MFQSLYSNLTIFFVKKKLLRGLSMCNRSRAFNIHGFWSNYFLFSTAITHNFFYSRSQAHLHQIRHLMTKFWRTSFLAPYPCWRNIIFKKNSLLFASKNKVLKEQLYVAGASGSRAGPESVTRQYWIHEIKLDKKWKNAIFVFCVLMVIILPWW